MGSGWRSQLEHSVSYSPIPTHLYLGGHKLKVLPTTKTQT